MPERVNPETLRPVPDRFAGIYCHSVRLDRPEKLLVMSGQIGVAMDGTVSADFSGQCHQAMDHVEALLEAHGMGRADIVKVTYFLTRAEDLPELTKIRQSRWHSDAPPAVTTLVVAGLASPDLLVEIEVLAGA